jgi:Flp pilus assembly protein TadG
MCRDGKPGQRGATTLELAFVLGLILLPMMFGIIDFSRALYSYHWVSYAARAGSRWASVNGATHSASCPGAPTSPPTPCDALSGDVLSYVKSTVAPGMGGTPPTQCATAGCLTVNATWLNPSSAYGGLAADCTNGGTLATNSPGCIVQVQVNYYYGSTLPFIAHLSGTTLHLQSTSQMVISQ